MQYIPHCNDICLWKWIGEKIADYEQQLQTQLKEKHGYQIDYDNTDYLKRADLLQEHSTFYVFGGEESYGYLGSDAVRDKDANGATLMFAELAANAKSKNLTVPELLDSLYLEYGYFKETLHSLVLEGAEGAAKIEKLATSYSQSPPREVDGSPVSVVRDYASDDFTDIEGDSIPKEKMLIVDLEDGRSFAVRPSGTEPKIKYYLYGRKRPEAGATFEANELSEIKETTDASLVALWKWLETDIESRLA